MQLNHREESLNYLPAEERQVIEDAKMMRSYANQMRLDANRKLRDAQRLDALVKVASRFSYDEVAGMTVRDLIERESRRLA